jgi:hypothetical protein
VARSVNELARRVIVSDGLKSDHRSSEHPSASGRAMIDDAENTQAYRF